MPVCRDCEKIFKKSPGSTRETLCPKCYDKRMKKRSINCAIANRNNRTKPLRWRLEKIFS